MVKVKSFVFGPVQTNCYVASDEDKNCVIIDCEGNGKAILQYIKDNELKLSHILLTHGHYDHIGAVDAVRKHFGCKVCIGEMEEDVAVETDVRLKDGQYIHVGHMSFETMLTPGHTSGSVCYILENHIFSGDTLFEGDCGRTDLATGSWEDMKRSLRKLKNLSGDYNVYPGHGPSTTLEYERKYNSYMNQ